MQVWAWHAAQVYEKIEPGLDLFTLLQWQILNNCVYCVSLENIVSILFLVFIVAIVGSIILSCNTIETQTLQTVEISKFDNCILKQKGQKMIVKNRHTVTFWYVFRL